VPYENIDNTYGLPARGKIAHSRNLNLIKDSKSTKKLPKKCGLAGIKENISPNQRIHTDYDLEIIGKDKKKSISSKKLDRFKSPGLEGVSKGKSNSKKVSVSKSRLSRKLWWFIVYSKWIYKHISITFNLVTTFILLLYYTDLLAGVEAKRVEMDNEISQIYNPEEEHVPIPIRILKFYLVEGPKDHGWSAEHEGLKHVFNQRPYLVQIEQF